MPDAAYNLAVETSSRRGLIALGQGSDVWAVAELPAKRRHNLDLIPAIDTLLRQHGLVPGDLAELYVSLGPGSFTGLRIAVATAKMLSLTLKTKLVGVPTLDVLRHQHPGAMVCLNVKRETAWAAPGREVPPEVVDPAPAFRSLEEILGAGLPLVADTLEDATPVEPDVRVLHRLGHTAAQANRYDDPLTLAPLYLREPEAVTLWDQRHGPEA